MDSVVIERWYFWCTGAVPGFVGFLERNKCPLDQLRDLASNW